MIALPFLPDDKWLRCDARARRRIVIIIKHGLQRLRREIKARAKLEIEARVADVQSLTFFRRAPFQRITIPVREFRARLVSALQKFHQRDFRRSRLPHVRILQNEFL